MKQREVADNDNTKWTCVQAYSMIGPKATDKANGAPEGDDGNVTVVCTPSGGEKTVRLKLPENWDEAMKDEELVVAIQTVR
jgi:hypothetical protein